MMWRRDPAWTACSSLQLGMAALCDNWGKTKPALTLDNRPLWETLCNRICVAELGARSAQNFVLTLTLMDSQLFLDGSASSSCVVRSTDLFGQLCLGRRDSYQNGSSLLPLWPSSTRSKILQRSSSPVGCTLEWHPPPVRLFFFLRLPLLIMLPQLPNCRHARSLCGR